MQLRATTVHALCLCVYMHAFSPGIVVDSEECLNTATADQVGKNSEDTYKKLELKHTHTYTHTHTF